MLFENDGSAADVVNYYAEIFGDGTIMDAMRRKMAAEQEGKLTQAQREVADTARRVNECVERRVHNDTGMVPDFSVPLRIYHGWAAAYKLDAEDHNIVLPGNGYECWEDSFVIARFKRLYPECVFKEAKRNARIIVNERALQPGGLVAA